MTDQELKNILKPLIESLSALAEKQALILQLLSLKLPDISDDERHRLQDSAKANERNVETWRQSLKTWK